MDSRTFADEMKPKFSGADLVLELENIESSVAKVSVDCHDILSETLFEKICEGTASTEEKLQAKALDYLQRAVLHFCMYEHLIFLMARIKNDGVTVQKSEHETTIFKYLQDELDIKLVSLGWFWMNRLIKLLNDNKDKFPDWEPAQDELTDIDITLDDFNKWVGIRDEYFMVVAKSLIREVWMECVISRVAEPKKEDPMVRALCYDVLGRACTRFAYFILPEPIRKDLNNEMGKNHSAQADKTIREKIADIYLSKARSYWTGWDHSLEVAKQKDNPQESARPIYTPPNISENDPFAY